MRFLSALLLLAAFATASPLIDQFNIPNYAVYNATSFGGNMNLQQQVTAGMDGTLAGFNVWANVGGSQPSTSLVRVALGGGPNTGPWLFSSLVTWHAGVNYVDISSANIPIHDGDPWVFVVQSIYQYAGGLQRSTSFHGDYSAYNPPSYPGGGLYTYALNGTPGAMAPYSQQLKFETFVEPPPAGSEVPEPQALLTAGTGLLLVFIGAARKLRKN